MSKKTKKVVMAFGAFDGIHTGHLHYLKESKKLGDYLIVSISRDKAEWKFPTAFNLPEQERKKLVEGLNIANRVILGSQKNALEKIIEIKPDIVTLTPYNIINPKDLQADLKEKGLSTKVNMVKLYRHPLYKPMYKVKVIHKQFLMGMPVVLKDYGKSILKDKLRRKKK